MTRLGAVQKSYGYLGIACLVLVGLADWLFYHETIGWSAGLYVALLIAAISFRNTRYLKSGAGKIVLIGVLGLVFGLILDPAIHVILLALVLLMMVAMVNSGGWAANLIDWGVRWLRLIGEGWLPIFRDNRIAARYFMRNGPPDGKRWGVGEWIVALLAGSVFLVLFSIANPVFAQWISNGWDALARWIQMLPELIAIGRIVFWISFAIGVWTLLRARVRRSERATTAAEWQIAELTENLAPRTSLAVRCLTVFNVIFLIETILDAVYLWGGRSLPAGMTYTEYAHRGAYPLIAAALLAGLFVIVTFRSGGESEKSRTARYLVYAWLTQTLLLTVSAAWRLDLYVSISNLTRLRFACAIWIGVVALGLAWTVVRIAAGKTNEWLVRVNILTATAVLYACCFVDFDAMIAQYNVTHCPEMGGQGSATDWYYMRILGPSAIPAIQRYAMNAKGDDLKNANNLLGQLNTELADEMANWRGWSIRRQALLSNVEGAVSRKRQLASTQ